MTENQTKLRDLFTDVLLISPEEFRLDLKREDVDTWDSLAVVSIAVGVEETFGHHMTPEEAAAVDGVAYVVRYLESRGVRFDG
jgi:acyl carrier protein